MNGMDMELPYDAYCELTIACRLDQKLGRRSILINTDGKHLVEAVRKGHVTHDRLDDMVLR